ncbi:hypothetical protein CYMTET_5941 [Cymbomonas tetramitiformis]|uniref:Uncharacterized protein n=1 Tax=Cymbomonas tetramitiformis TaxID=36881 RepID=A0AAE0LIX2_9CHLO|nr:hypothetical protein CYMTET_5941 [Cymbomonas tetramitiformis]
MSNVYKEMERSAEADSLQMKFVADSHEAMPEEKILGYRQLTQIMRAEDPPHLDDEVDVQGASQSVWFHASRCAGCEVLGGLAGLRVQAASRYGSQRTVSQ